MYRVFCVVIYVRSLFSVVSAAAETQNTLMTSQDLLSESPPPSRVSVITLEDSINVSPDISFSSDTQTPKDGPDVAPSNKADITLQLSPSQMTQTELDLKEIGKHLKTQFKSKNQGRFLSLGCGTVPETPSKSGPGIDGSPSVIEIAPLSLDVPSKNETHSEPGVADEDGNGNISVDKCPGTLIIFY